MFWVSAGAGQLVLDTNAWNLFTWTCTMSGVDPSEAMLQEARRCLMDTDGNSGDNCGRVKCNFD